MKAFSDPKSAIAIVGMACRFPGGVKNPDDYWKLLVEGRDAVTQIPADRFGTEFYQHPLKREPGKSYTFAAGVLDDVAGFDAEFFGISPREAEQMDPQQRMLLELTWESLEDAGLKPAEMAGRDCAVFVGVASHDYGDRSMDDLASIDAYSATGNEGSIASNRISYIFDLRGPSMSINTACSSSLVALHQASQAIINGDTDMALTGGVNLLLHPYPFIGFAKASMLSPNGRCKAFDASGDGYVRSEGGAVLVLKRLDRALADGDRIHAIIAGSGVNSDGYSQGGISVPTTAAQAALMQRVLANADVQPRDISYLEAHGTGTAAGDPIEAQGIIDVIGRYRDADKPLLIGSAKSNVGHLETASGMAGLVKAVLCLKHRAVPPSIHFKTPNPRIDFAGGHLRVVEALTPLSNKQGKPLLVGINSFGFGGTNAHVVLQEAAPDAARHPMPQASSRQPLPLVLNARAPEALNRLAALYLDQLEAQPERWNELASATAWHRQWQPHRALLAPATLDEGMAALRALAQGEDAPALTVGKSKGEDDRLALVFSGNGSQWAGMGKLLLDENPVFKQAVLEVDKLWRADGSASLVAVMREGATSAWLESTENAQPLLFALQVGVVRVLQARGVQYQACYGHSVGEVASAWACGALDLEQAVRVIKLRSQAQGTTRGLGRMAAAGLSEAAVLEWLGKLGLENDIEIAGVNSPEAVTLAGSLAGLQALEAEVKPRGVFFQMLGLDYAFHSRHMERIQPLVLGKLKGLKPHATTVDFISTVTGGPLQGPALGAEYWWHNIRKPVLFHAASQALIERGFRLFLEVGPHSILRGYVSKSLDAAHTQGTALPTLKRNQDGAAVLDNAVAQVVAAGAGLNTAQIYPAPSADTQLPAYPWQKQRYWLEPSAESYRLVLRKREHPLLGYRVSGTGAYVWENQIDPVKTPALKDHVVEGTVTFPGASYAEMALAAAREFFGGERYAVENLEIRAPAVFQQQGKVFRFSLDAGDGRFQIESRTRLSEDEAWTLNAVGRLLEQPPAPALPDPAAAFAQAKEIDGADLYQQVARLGLDYGPTFRCVRTVRVQGRQALAELVIPPELAESMDRFIISPALVDCGFHPLFALLAEGRDAANGTAYVPVQMGRVSWLGGSTPVRVLARVLLRSPHSVVADFAWFDAEGQTVARIEQCRFRRVDFAGRQQQAPDRFVFVAEPQPYADQTDTLALPAPQALLAQAAAQVAEGESAAARQRHLTETLPLLDVLASAYALRAVKQLGFLAPGAPAPIADGGLQDRIVGMLLEDGVLAREEDGGLRLADDALPSIEELWRGILAESPAHVAELTLLSHCGEALASVLDGSQAPGKVLPAGQTSLTEHLFQASPTWSHARAMIPAALAQALANWPAERPLRVLEIGSADSDLSQPLGRHLPQDKIDYTLAGSAAALESADLSAWPLIRTARFAPGAEPKLEGIGLPTQFDAVVLDGALRGNAHAAELLRAAHGWLAPGGMLLVAEAQPGRLADLVFGLHPEWWTGQRFPSAHTLEGLAQQAGFADVARHLEADLDIDGAPTLLAARRGGDIAPVSMETRHWILIAPTEARQDLAMSLAAALAANGQTSEHAGCEEALQRCAAHTGAHLVFLAASNQPLANDGAAVLAAQDEHTLKLAELARALSKAQLANGARLWVVASGGAPVIHGAPAADIRPDQAPVWGLGRVLMNESPELDCHLVDLAPSLLAGQDAGAALARALLAADAEEETLVTPQGRLVPRMMGADIAALRYPAPAVPVRQSQTAGSVLAFETPGSLRNLAWFPQAERELAEDEVEVEPAAVGLNFRDVMYAMGLLSDEAVENGFAGATIGMEMSGRVRRVGAGVSQFRPGDEVLGFAPACFASRVYVPATALAVKPAALSFEEGATIPTTFFTAWYALNELARLRRGERVLIHGAAGGVGIAAIQIALHLGAEVFATAGNDEKRGFVKLLGAHHVLDSRSLAFADDVMALTDGEGVDVVLNSLAGEAMVRSVNTLKPFGRFCELGKRDFYENSRLGLRPFRNNISYFGIDADQLMQVRPDLTARLFAEVMQLMADGTLRPLPYRAFPAERVEDAFRYMQQARQIGKILVTFNNGVPAPDARLAAPADARLALDPQAAYLVAGGVSGLGFATARWLKECGARHLVLVSRSGKLASEVVDEAQAWRDAGVTLTVMPCDITDAHAVAALVKQVQGSGTPLKGVVHSAMVIADALLANLDDERFNAVLSPKVAGAWNLHAVTRDLKLDFFITYSSATTFLGNPGQSNYVAGNAFLETLTALRRAWGLAATFMAWGPLEDVGFLARNTDTKEALQARIGGNSITSAQAMAALEHAVLHGLPGEALLWLDWGAVQRVMPAARALRYVRLQGAAGDKRAGADLRSQIMLLPVEEARELVAETLQGEMARILHLSRDRIPTDKPVLSLGMDSLMGMELGMSVEESFGVKLPVMLLAEGATVHTLAQKIVDGVLAAQGGSAGNDLERQVAALVAQHGVTMSDADLQAVAGKIETADEGRA